MQARSDDTHAEPVPVDLAGLTYTQAMIAAERAYLVAALRRANGNKSEGARLAGINVATFRAKCRNHAIRVTANVA